MPSRLAAIAIDAVDPRPVVEFWCAVLDWKVTEEDDDVISIGPATGSGPTIDIVRVPETKSVKNRLHLDLRAEGIGAAAELARLEELGARRVDVGQPPDCTWVVLADPEGNEFCLLGAAGSPNQP